MKGDKLQLALIIAVLLYFFILIKLLKKNKISVSNAILWVVSGIVMLILAVFPEVTNAISKLLGIALPSNALFAVAIFFLIIILMSLSAVVSGLNEKVKRLTQTVAILEKEFEEKGDRS